MNKVIFTGFGAFHTHSENPSELLLKEMTSLSGKRNTYKTFLLPVVFSQIPNEIKKVLKSNEDTHAVILCGLAASRSEVTFEKIALNWIYSPEREDNEGNLFNEGQRIEEHSDLAFMSSFPVEKACHFFNERGVKSSVSFTAGTYVCNQTFFHALSELRDTSIPCVFIHLPPSVNVAKFAEIIDEFITTL